ncbi:MAG: GNAT family N-acetyltransferase [Actinobacteria bacterium]|nr:GNAT family N-acetyltransferase [Actinomycetota bacterium]
MAPEIALRAAVPGEADALAEVSRRAFDSDLGLSGSPGPGGPPGYDDPGWQHRMMRAGDYWVIVADGAPVGGAIVFDAGGGSYELGRIFVDPAVMRRGIGTRAVALLEERYPDAARWILDTPEWNARTGAFYERIGFTRYGSLTLEDGTRLTLYEKRADRLF